MIGKPSRLIGGGYLTSTISVLLLAIPAIESARENRVLLVCLVGGMLLSVGGMYLRWRAHRTERHEDGKP